MFIFCNSLIFQGLGSKRREFCGLHVADYAEIAPLAGILRVKSDGRRAKDTKVLQQRLISRIVRSDIGLQPYGGRPVPARTSAFGKVYFSISLQDTHQSA